MIFAVQRYLEDYFERRRLSDNDQYAVKLANLYAASRARSSKKTFLARMARVRTAFFHANRSLTRAEFRNEVLEALDREFAQKKSLPPPAIAEFERGLRRERTDNRHTPDTIASILAGFRSAVERLGTGLFWRSRTQNILVSRPERAGQILLSIYAAAKLADRGYVCSELPSGVGYVDVAIFRRSVRHLLEMKVLRSRLIGVTQLAEYMKIEDRRTGWLILFDARPASHRPELPTTLKVPEGTVRIFTIDIRPQAPSRIKERYTRR